MSTMRGFECANRRRRRFHSWLGRALTPLAMAIILFRIHDEEALAQKEFVVEWEAYCRISNWSIPFIW